MVLPQWISFSVLRAKKKTGARKREKGNLRSCMVERLSISKPPEIYEKMLELRA
jgi:hypothetical protein